MKFGKTKRLIALLGSAALMLSGCGNNNAEEVLREQIIPDYEIFVAATDQSRTLFMEIADAAEAYIENPNEETKAQYLATQEENVNAMNNISIASSLGDEAKSAMREYEISEEDYAAMFSMFDYTVQGLTEWSQVQTFVENEYVEGVEAALELAMAEYEYDRKSFYYATMEMFAYVGDENIEYVKEVLAKYPTIEYEELEWSTDLDELVEKATEVEDEYRAAIDDYNLFIAELEMQANAD